MCHVIKIMLSSQISINHTHVNLCAISVWEIITVGAGLCYDDRKEANKQKNMCRWKQYVRNYMCRWKQYVRNFRWRILHHYIMNPSDLFVLFYFVFTGRQVLSTSRISCLQCCYLHHMRHRLYSNTHAQTLSQSLR